MRANSVVELRERVLKALRREGGTASVSDLAAGLGAPKPAVSRVLHVLAGENVVERVDRHQWKLAHGVHGTNVGPTVPPG